MATKSPPKATPASTDDYSEVQLALAPLDPESIRAYRAKIHAAAVERGRAIYMTSCAACQAGSALPR